MSSPLKAGTRTITNYDQIMKRPFILIVSIILLSVAGFFGFAIYTLENEEYHQSPCESSAEILTDTLEKIYHIWGWSTYPKNFCGKCSDYDSTNVDCKIITCVLRMSESELDFQQDSMIYNVMNLFWSFSQNKMVDSLYLTIRNNRKSIITHLSKADLKKKPEKIIYDTTRNMSAFSISHVFEGSEQGGGWDYESYDIKTRELKILSRVDPGDYDDVAEYYYNKELDRCKKDAISTLTIEIETANPKGQFVANKISTYVYEINTEHIKKKNAL